MPWHWISWRSVSSWTPARGRISKRSGRTPGSAARCGRRCSNPSLALRIPPLDIHVRLSSDSPALRLPERRTVRSFPFFASQHWPLPFAVSCLPPPTQPATHCTTPRMHHSRLSCRLFFYPRSENLSFYLYSFLFAFRTFHSSHLAYSPCPVLSLMFVCRPPGTRSRYMYAHTPPLGLPSVVDELDFACAGLEER
jgi:hypothetical protein